MKREDREHAALTERIVRARIEEAGLALSGEPFNFFTANGELLCTVVVRVPAALLEEQRAIEQGAKP